MKGNWQALPVTVRQGRKLKLVHAEKEICRRGSPAHILLSLAMAPGYWYFWWHLDTGTFNDTWILVLLIIPGYWYFARNWSLQSPSSTKQKVAPCKSATDFSFFSQIQMFLDSWTLRWIINTWFTHTSHNLVCGLALSLAPRSDVPVTGTVCSLKEVRVDS